MNYQSFVDSYIDGLVQGCSNSSALAMELLQYHIKPPIWSMLTLVCMIGNTDNI